MSIPNIAKYVAVTAVGAGGIGVAGWRVTVSLLHPYDLVWKGDIVDADGETLFCGRIKDKYDCKLSLDLSSITKQPYGGGIHTVTVSNITDILKNTEKERTVNTLYLFDKGTSTLWYLFKGQGAWNDLEIETEGQGESFKLTVNGRSGKKVDKKFEDEWNKTIERFNQSISKPTIPPKKFTLLKPISAKNIIWKLSYL